MDHSYDVGLVSHQQDGGNSLLIKPSGIYKAQTLPVKLRKIL